VPDSAFTGSAHVYWWWAIASLAPAVGVARALRRSGAAWSRPVVVLQIAISISIASLILPLLVADGIGAWVVLLWIPGSIVVPASVLLLALGASSRLRETNAAAILLGCAIPAIALLVLISPALEGSQVAAWTHQWLGESAELGALVAWSSKLPLTYGLPCMLVSLLVFLDEYLRPPKSSLRQALFAGVACATPALTTIACATVGWHYGFEPISLSYLVPSIVFGWILYPGRIAHLTARMAAIDALGEAIVIIDSTNKIVDANGRAIDLLAPSSGDLRGCSAEKALAAIPELLELLTEPSKICVEFFTGKTAGDRRCHEARMHELDSSESEGSRVFAIRDITSNRVAEDKLFYQAHFDSLTGLPNRRLFLDKISSMVNEAKQEGDQVALMYLDFDHFKEINDSLGHSAGDELLRIMAHRLRQHLRNTDTLSRTQSPAPPEVSRLGGDEFAILMSRFSSIEDVEEVAKRILALVSDPVTIGGQVVLNACSIGIAIFPRDGVDISTLVKNADSALYYAKSRSRGGYEFYRSEFGSKIVRKASLEKQLRGAIDAKELTLHYQPKIDLEKEEVGGAEALLRWDNSELGVVPPKEFIPVAEDCGLIASIGAWVIETACAQIENWRSVGLESIPISVNVSCFQFTRMDLQRVVTNALGRYDVPPDLLELELTESALLEDNDQTASCLRELRAIGVKISLDDFGTGYSALSYLSRVPLDVLKMDRAFIRDIHTDPSALGVASAVVAMAHSLDLRVVAEGVDCAEQVEPLKRMGCDLIQGFIFSAALDASEFARYLTPEGRRISFQLDEASALPTHDLVEAEVPAAGCGVAIASGETVASEEAVVFEGAVVTGETVTSEEAVVAEGAVVTGETVTSEEAVVSEGTVVTGETAVSEEAVVPEEMVVAGETAVSEEAVALEENGGDCPERFALIIDDDRGHIGLTAMRMNQMGIPSYYARGPDEGILFALQEPGRIRALLVSSETNPRDVARVAQEIANQSQGDRPSIVVVGEKVDPAIISDLQQKGPVWSLRIPFDDAELTFVTDAALSKVSDRGFPERNRVPIHLIAWTRVGDVTGHGVISALSPRGAFVEMKDPLPVGTAFQLEFSLSDWPVSIKARVVYLVGTDAGGLEHSKGVGVVFLGCDRETGDRIFEEVEKRSARYTP
jgi:diguanylate cyclase (GGDEF)-like protein